jgi:exosortase
MSTEAKTAPARTSLPWAAIAWFGAFLILCYWPVLARLVAQWYNDEDMGHGFFVPVVAGYIAWQRREDLMSLKPSPNGWGVLLLAWGAAQLYVATLGAELFLARTAFIISLIGIVLTLAGTRALRILAFPLFLLLFMVPIPAVIYNQITFPLQLIASQLAAQALLVLGVPVLREGNVLQLPNQSLNVVEACSGIRSLLTLTFLSLVYSYFFDKKAWMRVLLLVATVPIAIAANAARVTITGLLSEVNPKLAEGLAHLASGWLIFMLALAILVALHWAVNRVYNLLHGRK